MTSTLTQPTTTHGTFVIERTYPTSPERVFAAFSDPAKKRRWFADTDEATAELHQMDFRVGGTERTKRRMGEDTPFPGTPLTNDTVYQDIVDQRRIVFAYTMSVGDQRISASLATIEIFPTAKGTKLTFTEQGAYFENSDGAKGREHGWGVLLDKLDAELAR